MLNDLWIARTYLLKNNLSFVIVKNGKILYESSESGIKEILKAVKIYEKQFAESALADKVVGKAVVLVSLKVGIKSIYAKVISEGALDLASKHNISILYDEIVNAIMNKNGTDICPFEKAVGSIDDPEKAYKILCNMI
ncbi:MAG: DUF1893 domain-containing protein [Nitrososphaeria archaeon]|nr:DUF1893 domain-containing protein [Nitrososphaeria archaeon]